jgi:chromate transporter
MPSTTACCCRGPEAQQLATYIGWLMHRTWGGIIAGLLFVLPGSSSIIGAVLDLHGASATCRPWRALFYGIKPAVLAIVRAGGLAHRLARPEERRLMGHRGRGVRGIFALRVPFPLIILVAGSGRLFRRQGLRPPNSMAGGGHGKVRGPRLWPALIDDDTPTPTRRFNWLRRFASRRRSSRCGCVPGPWLPPSAPDAS